MGKLLYKLKLLVDDYQLKPNEVVIPGNLVDYVYVTEDRKESPPSNSESLFTSLVWRRTN